MTNTATDLTGKVKVAFDGSEHELSINLRQLLEAQEAFGFKGVDEVWTALVMYNDLRLIFYLLGAASGVKPDTIKDFIVVEVVEALGELIKPIFFGNRFDEEPEKDDDEDDGENPTQARAEKG